MKRGNPRGGGEMGMNGGLVVAEAAQNVVEQKEELVMVLRR